MTTADIHTHTTYSPDSIIRPQELVRSAELAGIDILCVTDHSVFE
jgi:predicted metal-dependent phosphoesterase TrpH